MFEIEENHTTDCYELCFKNKIILLPAQLNFKLIGLINLKHNGEILIGRNSVYIYEFPHACCTLTSKNFGSF